MPEPTIVLDRLAKSFGDVAAVEGLSLMVPAGEIFGFVGANGAGKTTTIRMLCGLIKPTSGHGRIFGRDLWQERYGLRAQFGYVAQKFSLYPDLTVVENLRFFGGAYRVGGSRLGTRIEQLLAQLDLASKRNALAGSLSGGMRQPTSGLDPVHRQQIWDLLYALCHCGTTIFVTTHYMDEAERCTVVGFLHQGRLLAQESPLRLKQHFKGRLLELHVEPVMEALARLRAIPEILGVALRSGRIRIYSGASETLMMQWQRQWPFADLSLHGHAWVDADMEDVFKAYSQGYDDILERTGPAS
jgi:drug efflux transport system ATP-binding protein